MENPIWKPSDMADWAAANLSADVDQLREKYMAHMTPDGIRWLIEARGKLDVLIRDVRARERTAA